MYRSGTLQEVVGCPASDMGFSSSRSWIELQEGILESIIKLHDRCLVATAVTVVRCTEDGHYILVVTPIVALHDQLMGSGDQREAVAVIEGLRDVLTKGVASTSGRDTPATTVIRIRPQQIAHGALMWHFLNTIQGTDMVQCVYGW